MEVSTIEEVQNNQFFIIAGMGYPSYTQRIRDALRDIANHSAFDHFFICVDAEEMEVTAKVAEIQFILDSGPAFPNCHIIVHNCCLETWFLGHAPMLRRNPDSEELRQFKAFYDVSENDPEHMACPTEYETKAQYHYEYLKAMLREQHLTYSKQLPGCTAEKHYFTALVERYKATQHIQSFGRLVEIWTSLGGDIPL